MILPRLRWQDWYAEVLPSLTATLLVKTALTVHQATDDSKLSRINSYAYKTLWKLTWQTQRNVKIRLDHAINIGWLSFHSSATSLYLLMKDNLSPSEEIHNKEIEGMNLSRIFDLL